jgi:hypothetical protein
MGLHQKKKIQKEIEAFYKHLKTLKNECSTNECFKKKHPHNN